MTKKTLGLLFLMLATHALHSAAPETETTNIDLSTDTKKRTQAYAKQIKQRLKAKQKRRPKYAIKQRQAKASPIPNSSQDNANIEQTNLVDQSTVATVAPVETATVQAHDITKKSGTPKYQYSVITLLALNPGANTVLEGAIAVLDEMANYSIECAHTLASSPELLDAVNLHRRLKNLGLRPNDPDVPTAPMSFEPYTHELETFILEPHELEALERLEPETLKLGHHEIEAHDLKALDLEYLD